LTDRNADSDDALNMQLRPDHLGSVFGASRCLLSHRLAKGPKDLYWFLDTPILQYKLWVLHGFGHNKMDAHIHYTGHIWSHSPRM